MKNKISKIKKQLAAYLEEGKYDLVIIHGREYLQEYPDDIEFAKMLTRTMAQFADEPSEAYSILKELIIRYPDSADLHATLADCYIIYGGKDQEAYEELKKAISIDSKNPALYSLLATVISTGYQVNAELIEAIDALKRAIEFESDNWQLYEDLGTIYWENGNAADAKQALEKALQLLKQPRRRNKNVKGIDEERYIEQLDNWISDIKKGTTFNNRTMMLRKI